MTNIEAYLAAIILGSPDMSSDIVQHLNDNPYLIVVDHLEAWSIPEGQSKRAQQNLLKDFLVKIHGGKSYSILASRHRETWLENLTPRSRGKKHVFSQHMTGLVTAPAVKLFSDEVPIHGGAALGLESVTSKYLEAMVELVSYNPLAIKMLAYDFSRNDLSIKEYFSSLLEGSTIQQHRGLVKSDGGARIIRQLQKYNMECKEGIYSILISNSLAKAANTAASGIDCRAGTKPPLHPTVLGMFWAAAPVEDMWKYTAYTAVGALAGPTS